MDTYLRDLISGNISQSPVATILFTVLVVWSLTWKGLGLWSASKNSDKLWFIAILVLNTAGIVEIFYLFVYSKNKLTINLIRDYLRKIAKTKKLALKRPK